MSFPANRTILGALLIAGSAFLTFAISTGVLEQKTRPVVVAAQDIAPGTRIGPSDVRIINASIDDSLVGHSIGQTSVVVGTTATGLIKSGELVQPGALVAKASAQSDVELSFSLPASHAVAGALSPGESVDVVTTEKGALKARVVVSSARVVSVKSASSGGFGGGGDTTITVAVASREDATAIAGAVDSGTVTLIRTTGVTP